MCHVILWAHVGSWVSASTPFCNHHLLLGRGRSIIQKWKIIWENSHIQDSQFNPTWNFQLPHDFDFDFEFSSKFESYRSCRDRIRVGFFLFILNVTFKVQRSTTLLLFENQITRHGKSSFQMHYDLWSVTRYLVEILVHSMWIRDWNIWETKRGEQGEFPF